MGSLSADDDLDVVWAQAMERYESITNVSLKAHNGFAAITTDITRTLDKSKAGNRAKAQAVMSNAMVCLQKFGGIIAQAASVAFGPSAQCWNAISFVVSAAQQYQKVLDGFTTLMERSVTFLERLNIFLGEKSKGGTYLDPRLRKDAYAVLSHFLTVLANSYKLSKSKWQKTKTVLNIVLFNDDAGVADALHQMEILVSNLTNTSVAVILKNVEGMAKFMTESHDEILRHEAEILQHAERTEAIVERTEVLVQQMKGEQDRQISQQKSDKYLDKIEKALQIKKDTLPWRSEQADKSRLRKGRASWLLERNTPFKQWADITKQTTNVMTMTSKEGFGKSYITSHVVSHLIENVKPLSGGPHGRVTIAYYYFSKDGKDEKVVKCLSSIIYQLAASDSDYAKAAANVCEQSESFGRADELWQRLVTDLESSMQGTYFIIIDGYSKADGDTSANLTIATIARRAMSDNERQSLRLFITGREDDLSAIPFDNHSSIPEIALGKPRPKLGLQRRASRLNDEDWLLDDANLEPIINEEDVIAFARDQIDEMCKDNEDLAAILNDPELDAPTKLAKGVRGDYKNLQIKLTSISTSEGDQQVRAIIDQAREDRATSLKRVVQNLNSTLSSDELEELNWLLTWILGAYGPKSIEFLQAALVLCSGKKHWLRTHIESKFSALLAIDEEFGEFTVSCKAEGLREMLSTTEDATSDAPAWQRPNMDLQKNEIAIVRRVVKTFCGDELYDKFDFERFFNQRAGDNVKRIHLEDENTVHAIILNHCLTALLNADNKDTSSVVLYAGEYLHEHLKTIDFLQIDKDASREIGDKLATLLWDTSAITTWWCSDLLGALEYLYIWKENSENMAAFATALKNPLVAAGLRGSSERDAYIKAAVSSDDSGAALFSRVAVCLGDRWFSSTLQIRGVLTCGIGIVAKMWKEPLSPPTYTPSVDLVERFTQWSQEHSNLNVNPAHRTWRKASGLMGYDHNLEALEACNQVEAELENELSDIWGLLLVKAKVYRGLEQYKEAIQCFHRLKSFDDRLLNIDAEYTRAYYEQILNLEGLVHVQLKDYDAAAACFELQIAHQLDVNPAIMHFGAVNLLTTWISMKSYDSVTDLLVRWRDEKEASRGLQFWLPGVGRIEEFHGSMATAVRETGQRDLVRGIYQQGLRIAGQYNGSPLWRYYSMMLTFYGSNIEEEHDSALDEWLELTQTSADDDEDVNWVGQMADQSNNSLCRVLLDKAVEKGLVPMSTAASKYLTRLEQFATMDAPIVRDCRQWNNDPRIALARLHVLAGDQTRAREILKDRMIEIFTDWPEASDEEALALRYDKIAHTLTILDDDSKAIAAWRLWEPKQPPDEAEEEDAVLGAAQEDADGHTMKSVVAATSDTSTAGEVEQQSKAEEKAGQARNKGQVDGETKLGSDINGRHPFADIPTEQLESPLGFSCDGCGKDWNTAGDQWCCKHCLDLQLCSSCHDKLLKDDLNPLICSKHHNFLYLPPFDRAAWEKQPTDMMVVGDELMSRQAWIEWLREEWGCQREVVDERKMTLRQEFQAATAIARWRRSVLRNRAQA